MKTQSRWEHHINIKQHLDPNAPLKDVIKNVCAELRKVEPFDTDTAGWLLVDELENAEDVEEFDNTLSDIYAHADRHGVWLGLK